MTPAPTERVRLEWADRVAVEYRSAAVTQHLALWLTQLGCTPDLVRAALRIASDELRHAELARRVVERCRGELAVLDRATLALEETGDPLERRVARACLGTFCLGETVAVPLFTAMRRRCVVPVARRALDRIVADEVRHRDFGWALLGWLLDAQAIDEALVLDELPLLYASLRATYAPTRAGATDTERAWGLIAPSEYAPILAQTVARAYQPRFHRLGIDATRALVTSSKPDANKLDANKPDATTSDSRE